MDPAQWMALLQQGDEEALERLLTHYDGMLRYIAGGILDHPQELEDCLAQVRLKLWESRGQYDPERSSPATWLTALCRNTAYYFYYERESVTTLDHAFLATIQTKAEGYTIYADLCAIPQEMLRRHNITFKKIPRDIARL